MTIDKTKLRALAEAAADENQHFLSRSLAATNLAVCANPATVLAMLAEIERLESAKRTVECRFEVSEDTLSTIRGCLRAAEGDIDQLKAENEALRKDAERYRFLRDEDDDLVAAVSVAQDSITFLGGAHLDSAVDAAMSKEASHD